MTPGTAIGLFVGPVAVDDPFGGVPGGGTCGLFEYAGGVCGTPDGMTVAVMIGLFVGPAAGVEPFVRGDPVEGAFGSFEYSGDVLEAPEGVRVTGDVVGAMIGSFAAGLALVGVLVGEDPGVATSSDGFLEYAGGVGTPEGGGMTAGVMAGLFVGPVGDVAFFGDSGMDDTGPFEFAGPRV